MSDEEDDAGSGLLADERWLWVQERVVSSLKCKVEDVRKLVTVDEAATSDIEDFLNSDDDDNSRLLITFEGKDVKCTKTPPTIMKKKGKTMFFLKVTPRQAIEKATIKEQVLVGDFSAVPLEHFSIVANEIFLPMLTRMAVSAGWPEVISKEVMGNFHKMLAELYMTIGETKGSTLLPLPPPDSSPHMEDKDRVHELENSIITWTRQIKSIYKADPEHELKQGNHVGPEVEVEFWRYKSANLNSIHEQLTGAKIQQVLQVLNSVASTYTPAFKNLCVDVNSAMIEANDNVKFLAPLVPLLNKLRDLDEFSEIPKLFGPIMHTIMLIWKHSKFYNAPSRLVILMRELCNDLIRQAHKFVEPQTILEEEPEDAVQKLKTAIDVCQMLKTAYFSYKTRVAVECPENPWRFQNSALFTRLDSFLERCNDILELAHAILQYNKLEKIEVGGTKGKILTTSVGQIFADFKSAIEKFHLIEYDLLNVEANEFDDDFYEFRVTSKELERRLGSVVIQGFEDCTTVYGCFKLLDSFDTLLERDVIMQDLEKKHVDLVSDFNRDLKTVLEIFYAHKDTPVIGRNMPPVAGAVSWIRGLRERVKDPFDRFKTLHANAVMESEETKDVFKCYASVSDIFDEFETGQFTAWCKSVESVGQEKLKQPLLLRYTDGGFDGQGKGLPLLRVNFDPALVKLLREVKYFRLLNLEVPQSAAQIFERAETFRQQTGNLELIVNIYNHILLTLKPVERPMLETKLSKIDEVITKGLKFLTWKSHGINEFITTGMSLVKDASSVLASINANVTGIEALLSTMEKQLMMERKDQKTYTMEDFQFAHETIIGTRHGEVLDAGEKIHKFVLMSNKVLKISKGAQPWKSYVDYIAGIVIEGMSKASRASLEFLGKNLTQEYITKNDLNPLIEVKLELVGPDIAYTPSIDLRMGNELREGVFGWIKDFTNIGKLISRLDTGEGDYLVELEEDVRILLQVQKLSNQLTASEVDCITFRDTYRAFEYLWVKDIEQCFQEFMLTIPEDSPEGTEPTLEAFNEEIAKYKGIQEEVAQLSNIENIGWLRIDAKPIKQAIGTWVSKWSYRFTQHLSDRVTNKTSELLVFIEASTVTLEKEVEEGDAEALIEVMGCIRDIRERMDATDEMFEPLRNTVVCLKKWGVSVSDETVQGLETAPHKWAQVKKQNFDAKDRLNPLQNKQAAKIKTQVEAFSEEIETFRENFVAKAPLEWSENFTDAYTSLDTFNVSVDEMEERANHLREMQSLFDLMSPDFRQIKNSRRDVLHLKTVWDTAAMIIMKFKVFKAIKWIDIKGNTDALVAECKVLTKTVKQLDKYVKNWSVFKGLEDMVRNMLTALPLVQDLAHPAMRDRHWKKLMKATGKVFTMDDSFALGDLLNLKLFDFAEEVGDIVDAAQKELGIEKQLDKIEATWEVLNLDFIPYGETEVVLISLSEELIEALDDGQVQLQTLGGSKYVAGNPQFLEMVTAWQGKLGAVDQTVRTSWQEVQKKWVALEPIFVGSADIRVQLPEDSKRFDGVDAMWKEMMKEAPEMPNCIQAAMVGERQEMLDSMLGDLELCEKSLNDYLETKRLAFPRFYFVAAADLLDILSKGSSPHLLQKHFSKNFDSINKLEFSKNTDGTFSNVALGMHSPQGEYVEFPEPLVCSGPVEGWLNMVMDTMRITLAHVLTQSSKSYDEKPREDWLFDQCAQITVLVSRIVYTEDINVCFEKLEEGDDNALKEYENKMQGDLEHLSRLINGNLGKGDRTKVINLCTIDVHGRDVIARLINERVESVDCFQWQSQLRYRIDETDNECKIAICDFVDRYTYEYIGNCGCLVITPLTDRCYITLTQASRLCLGGAPAGPAGTGKTETTKDLGRALGIMVYVFNCSDQMDFRVMAGIYKGLAQTGCWGCFDEFNRITIEVLSVCSTQYKQVLDAIRARLDRFPFEEEEIPLFRTVMAFITMNPGYAGRTELPESLKALFRPVSMVVPDMVLITQIMLFGAGFKDMKLATKFMLCYNLAADLLSAAMHYDWKLRAVKTTLCVAGSMKRAAPELSEDKVLLRAMRDFNLGKLLGDDVSIFMGLLDDLFPKTLELVPRQLYPDFEEKITEATLAQGLQDEAVFKLKISQLREIFDVRWSVFLLGCAGCGKTKVWQVLQAAQILFGEKTLACTLNPKAVTRNELYGYVSMATREWKDGLLSQIFRDLSNGQAYQYSWIILDGDIDAEWIETMNTVMDDNKILTLVSNERIPLTGDMRLLFEIGDLRNASPATVSRAGVIYLNEEDVSYMPFVNSWLEKREDETERNVLIKLFAKYVAKALEGIRKLFKLTIPLMKINMVQNVCYLLDGLLGLGEGKSTRDPELIETYFAFSCVWAFGGNLLKDKAKDHREAFSRWWKEEFKTVKFPDDGQVYDYCVEIEKVEDKEVGVLKTWSIADYHHQAGTPIGTMFVDTPETSRLGAMFDLLQPNHHYCMFVGLAGTGKTVVMREKLRALDPDLFGSSFINLNCFTDSLTLQMIMEGMLEKKAGIQFGPPGNSTLIYFVDDLNMPLVDKYGTQEPIALLRVYTDYHMWYEREKLGPRKVKNCDLMACMNQAAGSFVVDARLQRNFSTFSCQLPPASSLLIIYGSILNAHVEDFDAEVSALGTAIASVGVELQDGVANIFRPSAVKFHYLFNLGDISTVFGGMLRASPRFYTDPFKLMQLFLHEACRVYRDRLTTDNDMQKFDSMLQDAGKKHFSHVEGYEEIMNKVPNIFTSFVQGGDDGVYLPVRDWEQLNKVLVEQLNEHNETNAQMNLVLFPDAMEHVTRIARIIEQPRGNALLVGVGGSGKQSLSRLSAFICGYEVYQITVTSAYGVNAFREDLAIMYMKAGVKGIGTLFLFTDQQIVDENFLVFMNDMLSSGDIPNLFPNDEMDNICNAVRPEVKQAGLIDTRDQCWEFFIEKVRKYLHVALCFSPVGDKFRVRARQFPALVSCTQIDWFHSWSQEALIQVANKFLADLENLDPELQGNMADHMAFVHLAVTDESIAYLESERRYNYVTPKSFLELIALYKSMLKSKLDNIQQLKERLETGLEKLQATAEMVGELKESLIGEQKIVEEKKKNTDALLVHVGQEQAIAEEEKSKSSVEEEKCAVIAAEVGEIQKDANIALEAAEPIIIAAEAALNSLTKAALTELKAFGSPAEDVVNVLAATAILTAGDGKATKAPKDLSWNASKKLMANVDKFLNGLLNFDKDNLSEPLCVAVENKFLSDPGFTYENILGKSGAAAGLCSWVINICKYFRIYQMVAPKRAMLKAANEKLDGANGQLTGIRAKLADLDAKLQGLTDQFEAATEEKNNAIAQAEKTMAKAGLADRLVNGLADEGVRWAANIEEFAVREVTLIGDSMLGSAFVSYVGAFNAGFRTRIVQEKWIPDMIERQIPMTEGVQPIQVLTDDAEIAGWANESLPSDDISVQNGAIICNSERWPLMIDPQLQGIGWITKREGEKGLRIVQLNTPKYLDQVEQCIINGEPIIIENIGEEIDAVLDPVLARATIKKGRNFIIKLGDKEVDYDTNFQLYLQTKLANPHYIPEVQAQCTMVNFTVTEAGLEDQLLALVVGKERPDLEAQRSELIRQQNDFKVQLKGLEDNLLFRLANSQGDILEDIELIENLEETKKTSTEIQAKVVLGKETSKTIGVAREIYRPVAARGSLLFFLVNKLNVLAHMYQYSMANFVDILNKGIDLTPATEDVKERIANMVDVSCFCVFSYAASGLFERDKLIFASQLCFKIMQNKDLIDPACFEFLLRGPQEVCDNPIEEWLPNQNWWTIKSLEIQLEQFANITSDLEGSAKRWREWCEHPRAETEPLPGDWKRLGAFDRLLVIRCMRPDRMTDALAIFVTQNMHKKYTVSIPFNLERSFADTRPDVPVFFFLSPGVDVMTSVEALAKKMNLEDPIRTVSLGQGQEGPAERAIWSNHKSGGWTALQNIHLTPGWTKGRLEGIMDKMAEGAHPDFRLFLSAEPNVNIPISILQASVKLTNEPPDGMQANVSRAINYFTDEMFEECSKGAEFKNITFALCYFHAVLLQRKKFGSIGFNFIYPFTTGDLVNSAQCCINYLESNSKVPWDDLKYMFGEIMYGGHVFNDWDRRLTNCYLNLWMRNELLDSIPFFPGFMSPQPMNIKGYNEFIEESFPPESPLCYGLHPNAEISFRLQQAANVFRSIIELQPRSSGGAGTMSREDRAKVVLDDVLERLPDLYDMVEIGEKLQGEERTPYTNVFLQEIERMNVLLALMKETLFDLDLGLKGDLTISDDMEKLLDKLSNDAVPPQWEKKAYPSLRTLGMWVMDVLQRCAQLTDWTGDCAVPKVSWFAGFFNPQSFLVAVQQTTARRNEWPLDKTVILVDVTKKRDPEEIDSASRDGSYVCGLTLDGCRWDDKLGALAESFPKELFAPLPVMLIKAVTADKAEQKDTYGCPCYKTRMRPKGALGHPDGGYVFTAGLKTKEPPSKWITAGVALLTDIS